MGVEQAAAAAAAAGSGACRRRHSTAGPWGHAARSPSTTSTAASATSTGARPAPPASAAASPAVMIRVWLSRGLVERGCRGVQGQRRGAQVASTACETWESVQARSQARSRSACHWAPYIGPLGSPPAGPAATAALATLFSPPWDFTRVEIASPALIQLALAPRGRCSQGWTLAGALRAPPGRPGPAGVARRHGERRAAPAGDPPLQAQPEEHAELGGAAGGVLRRGEGTEEARGGPGSSWGGASDALLPTSPPLRRCRSLLEPPTPS